MARNSGGAEAEQATLLEREELVLPELSEDQFSVQGKTFKIRQLPYTYEKQFIRLVRGKLGQLWDSVVSGNGAAAADLIDDELLDALPETVAIICRATHANTTKEWVEQRLCAADMIEIVRRQIAKNKLQDKVADFFLSRRGGAGTP